MQNAPNKATSFWFEDNFEVHGGFKLRTQLFQELCCNTLAKRKQSLEMEVEDSKSQEVLELQKRLHEQFLVRHAIERALTNRPLSASSTNEKSVPKDAIELIKDIAVLELEVVYLEQYLLSMYRKTFEQQHAKTHKKPFLKAQEHDIALVRESFTKDSTLNPPKECKDNEVLGMDKLLDSGIHRSHSSLSQRLARASPSREFLAKAVDSYHSLPLSMLEQSQCADSNTMSLAHHLGTSISDHVQETPNSLSEKMISSISAIYCELADPPLFSNNTLSSPSSFSSATNEFSSFNSHSDNNPLFIKINGICRDSHKWKDTEPMLQKFRSLVYRLEEVDPRRMKHKERLAFWINVHNTLVMHAFLAYGTPRNNLKRASLILKAAYNVGGHNVSVEMIQSSILGCRMPRPGQWLRFLFSSKTKLKSRDAMRSYAIEHREPRLHFALCSGSHSDPTIRIYRPESVLLELEAAKEEYIGSTIRTNKERKVLLPKIVELFVKDSGMSSAGLVEMIERFVKIEVCDHRRVWKSIEYIPHDFSFRYLLSKELG